MRIIDRYIIQSTVLTFAGAVFFFALLFIFIDSAVNLDEFINRKVSFNILVQYYLACLPYVLVQTSAFASLIAVLLTYTNLNGHNELIALRTSGLNFWQISRPAICFALLTAALVFLLNERFIPRSEEIKRQIKNDNLVLETDRTSKKKSQIKNLTFYGLKNRLYYIDSFDPNTYALTGINIITFDGNQNITEKIVALKGEWTGIAWKFFQCHITTFPESITGPTKVKVYAEKLVDVSETPQDFFRQRLDITAMNIKQLRDYIHRFSASGATAALNNLYVDLNQKISFPMRNLVIILTGLPFALRTRARRKGQTFTALGISILIALLYYVTDAVGLAFGKGGLFTPILAAWIAPIIFLLFSTYLIQEK